MTVTKWLTPLVAIFVATTGLAIASSMVSGPAVASSITVNTTSCPPVVGGVLNAAPSVRGAKKTIALTFDDGPGKSTRAIIRILKAFHVRATFFNIGWYVGENPSLVKLEAADGFLMGDHTNSHPNMKSLRRAAQTSEIVQVMVLQRRYTGTVPCVFRPPYGAYNATTRSVVNRHGMTLWMWSDSGADWLAKGSASKAWVRKVEKSVIRGTVGQSHPVVLLHDQKIAMPSTVAALPYIIRWYEHRGYTFVDLLGRAGPPDTCGSPRTAIAAPTFSLLPAGSTLASGESKYSANGQFILEMNSDGQLTYSEVGGPTVWSTPTVGSPGAAATVANGALNIVGTDGRVLWTTETTGPTTGLELESNGSLALTSGAASSWSSNSTLTSMYSGSYLKHGWYISSPNSRCQLMMTSSGALTLVTADHQNFWHNAAKAPGGRTVLDISGSVETFNDAGRLVWSSGTSRHHNDVLSVNNTGTLTLATDRGAVIWATQ